MKETAIVKACLQFLQAKGVYCWRNNTTGIYNKKSGGYFFHGLSGVSDILGIIPQKCPCALQGVFLAVEVKSAKGKVSEAQDAFLKQINERGGFGIVVHSVEELDYFMKDLI